jgi:hypothetical protein
MKRRWLTWLVIGLVVATGLWAGITKVILLMEDQDYESASWIGGTFGAVNALFSAFAFIGVITTIWLQSHELALQRRELQLQRQELEATRKELSRAADAQTKSEQALSKQVDSLLLAAYLNVLESVRAGYAVEMSKGPSFNPAAPEKHAKIRTTLEAYLTQLEPRVTHLVNQIAQSDDAGLLRQPTREKVLSVHHRIGEVAQMLKGITQILKPYRPSMDLAESRIREAIETIQECDSLFTEPSERATLLIDELINSANLLTECHMLAAAVARGGAHGSTSDVERVNSDLLKACEQLEHWRMVVHSMASVPS